MAANGDTAPVLQAKPVPEVPDPIYQAIGSERTARRTALHDSGLVKVVIAYWDQDQQKVLTPILTRATLDKITNTVEDEAVA